MAKKHTTIGEVVQMIAALGGAYMVYFFAKRGKKRAEQAGVLASAK